MKFRIDGKDLFEACSLVMPWTPNKTFQFSNCIQLVANDTSQSVGFAAANLEEWTKIEKQAMVEKAGTVLLEERQLTALARQFADESFEFELLPSGDQLKISTQYGNFTLSSIPFELPEPPDISPEAVFDLNAKDLLTAIKHLLVSTSTGTSGLRLAEECVFATVRPEGCFELFGTDGNRLSYCKLSAIDLVCPDALTCTFVVKHLKDLVGLLNRKDKIRVSIGRKQVEFLASGVSVTVQLAAVESPLRPTMIDEFIEFKPMLTMTLSRNKMASILGFFKVISSDKEHGRTTFRERFDESMISLELSEEGHGGTYSIPIKEWSHETPQGLSPRELVDGLTFQVGYLLDPLEVIPDEEIILSIKDYDDKARIQAVEDKEGEPIIRHLMMPCITEERKARRAELLRARASAEPGDTEQQQKP